MRQPYTKKQVIDTIERRSTEGIVPTFLCLWWGDGLEVKYGKPALKRLEKEYPDDILGVFYDAPGEAVSATGNPDYRWGFRDYSEKETHSIGKTHVLLEDWNDLDEFVRNLPDPMEPGTFDYVKQTVDNADNRYVLGCFWRLFHERFWSIRGMENLMLDYYDAMPQLKKLGSILLEFYFRVIDRFSECGVDGIFTSDDLGHQTSLMMSPSVFRELYFPLYKELVGYVHRKGMHFFLHSCGNNSLIMEDLILAGVDVFHPIQAGCMDYQLTAKQYGRKLSFLYGIDVQHLLPEGTPRQIHDSIVEVAQEFHRLNGGLLFASGNGIMPDTSLENIEAMLNTTHQISRYI